MTELFVAGDLSGLLDERRMQSKIAQLKDHYLICGFGRVGRQVAKDLRAGDVPFVVIDDNPDVREYAEEEDVLLVEGRGSDDHTMQEAGIEPPTTDVKISSPPTQNCVPQVITAT